MFNAFEGPPRIVRLWGHGEVLEYGTKEYNHFVEEEGGSVEFVPGVRAVIKVHIHQVGSSKCSLHYLCSLLGFLHNLQHFQH